MARRQTNRLTAAEVRTAKPGPKPRYLADGNGLMLRVTLSGSKQWIQRIMVNGKRRDRGLGGYPLVSLAEAREVAFDNRKRARRGEDPQPEPKRRQQGPTFSEAQAVVLEQKRPTWKNATAARNWETTMRDYVVPRIGDLHVNDDMLDTPQVDDVLRPIAEAGKKATCKALAPRIRAVTQWAAIRGHRKNPDPVTPVMRQLAPLLNGEARHHKALPWAEVGDALTRIDATRSAQATKLALRFLALTAARPGEVRNARWDQIDLDTATWTRESGDMKGSRQHRVPLSRQALEVLTKARELTPDSALVFVVDDDRLGSSTLAKAMARSKLDASPHGFRASFKGWARDHDVNELLSEFALAHVEKAVVAAYARNDLLAKRRAVMQAWADAIAG